MPQAYYIVPLLIEQPTWGGLYIAQFKSLTHSALSDKKIGQSYELFDGSLLSAQPSTGFFLAESGNLEKSSSYDLPSSTQTLRALIQADPVGVLGKTAVTQYGEVMPLLIKFTQAQENSYQLHVKKGAEFGQWLAKPESWYFFEPGKATLGLKYGEDVAAYQQRCQAIYDFSLTLSASVKAGEKTVEQAQAELNEFINQDHPRRYVNTVAIPTNSIVEISAGGIHHSWEAGPEIPDGNIVYEVQQDVKDEVSTLRSFDQGKMKSNGEVRPLTINEYFQALDTSLAANDPSNLVHQINATTGATSLFETPWYHLTELQFAGEYSSPETQTTDGFHHLFVKEGVVTVQLRDETFTLIKGQSLFIPANSREYTLRSAEHAVVLKTTI